MEIMFITVHCEFCSKETKHFYDSCGFPGMSFESQSYITTEAGQQDMHNEQTSQNTLNTTFGFRCSESAMDLVEKSRLN